MRTSKFGRLSYFGVYLGYPLPFLGDPQIVPRVTPAIVVLLGLAFLDKDGDPE